MAAENPRRCRFSTATIILVTGMAAGTTAIAQPTTHGPADPRASIAWSPERSTASRATASALDPSAVTSPVLGDRYSAAPPTTAVAAAPPVAGPAASESGQLALLVRNPKQEQGLPPFALADQTGTVQRYVEPVEGVDLERFVGQVVVVRHDTGRTLLASQLDLPHDGPFTPGGTATRPTTAAVPYRDAAVVPARYQPEENRQPPEPDLADTSREQAAETIPAPRWADEDTPAPGNSLYMPPIHEPDFAPHSDYCPHCENGYCDHAYGPPMRGHGHYQDQGLLGSCLHGYCRPTGCGPGARGAFYARGEYLWWWFDGMSVPLLVVAGEVDGMGTASPDDDVLLVDEVLFGGGEYLDEERHGGRITVGWFLDPCGFHAIEGDYLTFGTVSTGFFAEGDPILPDGTGMIPDGQRGIGRPFFRFPGAVVSSPDIEDVVFTNIGGSIAVDITSNYESAGLRVRHNICCVSACQPGCGDCCDVACGSCCGTGPCQRGGFGTRRIDMTFGVRYANLEERLAIVEDLERADGQAFFLTDSFGTGNDFYGGELGFIWEWIYRRWKVDLLSRLAVGNTRQRVVVDGSTVMTAPDGDVQVGRGGLLALDSNIGSRETDKLTVLPEIGITLGYQLTCNLSFTVGYSFMYWSSVARPGDQIDLDINPDLLPEPGNLNPMSTNPFDRPRPFFEQTDFFAHGVNFGLEYRH